MSNMMQCATHATHINGYVYKKSCKRLCFLIIIIVIILIIIIIIFNIEYQIKYGHVYFEWLGKIKIFYIHRYMNTGLRLKRTS